MPLRDHFHPPVSKRGSWEGFQGQWPGMIVQQIAATLPAGFVAEPRVHLGSYYEIDVCAFEQFGDDEEEALTSAIESTSQATTGVALATKAPPTPTLSFEAEFPDQYAYEILIFDIEKERRLVAAVEFVSPANKDRPSSRRLFVAKCYNLLRNNVCVSIVDLVTTRKFNLYAELLALLNFRDQALGESPPATYAVTCRKVQAERGTRLDIWSRPLTLGQPLPTLPIWLSESVSMDIDLESSYEETCRVLRLIR